MHLELRPGTVHAVIGENGAGKSTFMKLLAGVYPYDTGQILLDGVPYSPRGPAAARNAGVAMIYQELTLAPHLSVEANITLGQERRLCGITRSRRNEVRDALARLGHPDLDPRTLVGALPIGLRQVVEIARALIAKARILILDEPTSSLSREDTQALFTVVRALRTEGLAILYISHFLEEVGTIADDYTVLRDGATVAGGAMADTTLEAIVEAMIGRQIEALFPRPAHALGEPALTVTDLGGRPLPDAVSFELRRGEVLGIAGLVGSGRSETLRALFGLDPADLGSVTVTGTARPAARITPWRSLELGTDLLSEDRKGEGLATDLSVRTNLTLSCLARHAVLGFIARRRENAAVRHWCRTLGIRSAEPDTPVRALSGGNQQKIAVARLLEHDSPILLLDEPTRGIDVGSKAEIYRLIGELASRGKAVVFVSSYLPELLGVCHSLAVMHRGRLSAKHPVSQWTEAEIMQYATSGRHAAQSA